VIYYLYFSYQTSDTIILINNPTNFKGDYQTTINLQEYIKDRNTLLKVDKGYGITINTSLYISNIANNHNWISNFDKLKTILNIGDNIIIGYKPKIGHIYIILKFRNISGENIYTEQDMGYIPIQKWTNHTIIINEHQIIYILDGKIIASKKLTYIPIIDGMILKLGDKQNNFMGNVKYLDITPYPIELAI
jgi:hypothetical protein